MLQTVTDAAAAVPAVAEADAATALVRWRWARRNPRLALEGAAVALLTLGCLVWALQLWRADLTLPLRYTQVDDTKFYLMLVKSIIGHGWFLTNPSLGAPFGQQLYDFPQGADNLNFLLIKLFGLFSSNPALVANLFFLSTFALAGLACHLVLRRLGVSVASAAVCSVLFALLPYHFLRGESHLLLSAYYSIPLAAYLFLELAAGHDLFTRRARPAPRALRWLSRRSIATVALCVVVGSSSLYYATLAEALLVAALIVIVASRRPRRQAITGALLVAVIAASVAVNLAPSLVYELRHGGDPQLTRSALQDEEHGLKLTNLVLPNPNSRIGPLRSIAGKYDTATEPSYCEACYASLGTVGTVGFLWLGLCGLGALLGAAGWYGSRPLFRHAALGVIAALAIATIGGVSSLVEFFITPNIRGWNRISLFIAFFSLMAAGLLIDGLRSRMRRRRAGTVAVPVVLGAVLAFGVYDQTSADFLPQYSDIAREYRSDAAFVKAIETRLAPGASVFQLPYVPFPEGYPLSGTDPNAPAFNSSYELLRGYLHSTTLRWSYGAMKGRSQDWSAQLAAKPLALVVPAVAAAGFQGMWVDPQGYSAAAGSAAKAALQTTLGQAPLVSPAGDLWFFDLRPYRARLARTMAPSGLNALRQATLYPLRTNCSSGQVSLFNPASVPRSATLVVALSAGAPDPATVRVAYPGGGAQMRVGQDTVLVRRRVVLAPGAAVVRLASAGGTTPAEVRYATLIDDAYQPLGASLPADAATPVGLVGPPCPIASS